MIFISVISHGHKDILIELNCLPKLNEMEGVCAVVLDNLIEAGLDEWCSEHSIAYLNNKECLGFGENNNRVFKYCQQNLTFNVKDDWFVVLNPDVDFTLQAFNVLMSQLTADYDLYGINLHKDIAGQMSDDSIRNFPSLSDFVSSFVFGVNKTKVDKALIKTPCDVDWAAGSFLVFKASHYQRLGGFDTRYFMYCEDIDICFRSATKFGCKVRYLPQVKARHLAQHGNRKLFSKHFYWHVASTLRFLWRKFKVLQLQGKKI